MRPCYTSVVHVLLPENYCAIASPHTDLLAIMNELAGSRRFFITGILLLVVGAILRSAIATRLDSFTVDEAYHIASGVAYWRHAAFRINPEHPPLVKLWVGAVISATGFWLDPLRQFADKGDERSFAEHNVYFNNDFRSVQRRARIAMWALNGLSLILFAFALRRAFGAGVAIGTLLFLAIDPTVAAHLPVVMTDLPVALLSAAAVVLATIAFRTWLWTDLIACSVVLGLDLATKQSAPVFLIFIALAGVVLALTLPISRPADSRALRFAKLFAVLVGALIILWGAYFFRFSEGKTSSKTSQATFNRALDEKITDVQSSAHRSVLSALRATHIVPRAYVWGFADTTRAGLEGRAIPITAFGRAYITSAPRYFFPVMIALKLPIGLGCLVIIGLFLYFARRLPHEWNMPLTLVLGAAIFFLAVLLRGVTYAGIRHALPVVVLLAIWGGAAIQSALHSDSKALKAVVSVALIAAVVSALPVIRPWEYFNETIGGTRNGYLYFSDEGVDLWQRGAELASYYHQALEATGELPLTLYGASVGADDLEQQARGVDWLGRDLKRDEARLNTSTFSGTILVNARFVGMKPYWDLPCLRNATPAARLGNLMVFRGQFACDGLVAPYLYFAALSNIYAETPDLESAERLLRRSATLDPSAFFVSIDLGNLCLKRGSRECALQAYEAALQHADADPPFKSLIADQIKRVSSEPLDQVRELRDPFLE